MELVIHPVIHAQRFKRLPKDHLVMFASLHPAGNLPNITSRETGEENLSWLIVDLIILTFDNDCNYSLLEDHLVRQELLTTWKSSIASKPFLGFSEIIWPNRVTHEIVTESFHKLVNDDFFINHFFPELRNQLIAGYHDPYRFIGQDLAPIEKTKSRRFIQNYIKYPNH